MSAEMGAEMGAEMAMEIKYKLWFEIGGVGEGGHPLDTDHPQSGDNPQLPDWPLTGGRPQLGATYQQHPTVRPRMVHVPNQHRPDAFPRGLHRGGR